MNISIIISVLSITISFVVLILNLIDNKRKNINSEINIDNFKRDDISLIHVETNEKFEKPQIKLAVFNTSNKKVYIHCLKAYIFDNKTWRKIEVVWWPSENCGFTKEKKLKDEYRNLLIDDFKNIFIELQSEINYQPYKFELETSFGTYSLATTITGSDINFNIDYKKTKTTANNGYK